MKKRLFMIFGLVLLMAGGFAAAAMITVNADRDVSVDIAKDINGAIKFEAENGYEQVVNHKDGIVHFDLNGALNKGDSFNPDAIYTIGSPEKAVFKITNNLPAGSPISVSFDSPSIELRTQGNVSALTEKNSVVIEPSQAQTFYFVVNAKNQKEVKLEGKLLIR